MLKDMRQHDNKHILFLLLLLLLCQRTQAYRSHADAGAITEMSTQSQQNKYLKNTSIKTSDTNTSSQAPSPLLNEDRSNVRPNDCYFPINYEQSGSKHNGTSIGDVNGYAPTEMDIKLS